MPRLPERGFALIMVVCVASMGAASCCKPVPDAPETPGSSPASPARAKARFEPPDGKTLLIIGQNAGTLDRYIGGIGIVPAGFMAYTSIQEVNGLDYKSNYEGVIQFAQPDVDRHPNTVVQIGLYMVDALDRVIAGDYDPNIERLGDWIRNTKRPVFLRIGYEFDGAHNHYDPEKYVLAYRRIVDRLRKKGVDNVAYVWHATCAPAATPLEAWYPGDDYVDWIALSYFDQPQSMMMPTVQSARRHRKPMMIAEATPRAASSTYFGKGSWDSWFTPFFKFVEHNDIKAVSYIDDNWESMAMWKGKGWGDARVEANGVVKQKWIEEIRKPRYLHSSTNLFKTLGHR